MGFTRTPVELELHGSTLANFLHKLYVTVQYSTLTNFSQSVYNTVRTYVFI